MSFSLRRAALNIAFAFGIARLGGNLSGFCGSRLEIGHA
jgi:hypothetical protein